jgi:hypothetical protein
VADPLFNASEAVLKQKVRLSALTDGTDADVIYDNAVMNARIKFYRVLGAARVSAILSTALSAAPSTDAEIIRALAASVEVKMVWCELLRKLPNAWLDTAGDAFARRNDEAPLREKGPSELELELARCEGEIRAGLAELADPVAESSGIRVWDGTRVIDGVRTPAPGVGKALKFPVTDFPPLIQ